MIMPDVSEERGQLALLNAVAESIHKNRGKKHQNLDGVR